MTTQLADKRCVPCRGGTPPLTADDIAPLLAHLDGWHTDGDTKLVKSFRLKNFVQAVELVNALTPVAEAEGHHPQPVRALGRGPRVAVDPQDSRAHGERLRYGGED